MHAGTGGPAAGEGAASGACQGDLSAAQPGGANAIQVPRCHAAAAADHPTAPPYHLKLLYAGLLSPIPVYALSSASVRQSFLGIRELVMGSVSDWHGGVVGAGGQYGEHDR